MRLETGGMHHTLWFILYESYSRKMWSHIFSRELIIIIGVNKILLVVLIIFLPESRLWLDSNANHASKSVLERFQNIRIKPNQGIHRVSITVHNFISKRTSNYSLPGLAVNSDKCVSTSSTQEIHNFGARRKISILTKARRNSGWERHFVSIDLKIYFSSVFANAFIFLPRFTFKSENDANNFDSKRWLDCSYFCSARDQYIFRATPRKFLFECWNHGNRRFVGIIVCDSF